MLSMMLPRMKTLLPRMDADSQYVERKRYRDFADQGDNLLEQTTTLYVGNLSFYTTEEQIYELFQKCGPVKRVIVGLDRFQKTPCGFCFVEYYDHEDVRDCMKYINGTKLDERIIRTDLDPGFREGRQYGRGRSGGQVRDEYREDYDVGRGGWGKAIMEVEDEIGDGDDGKGDGEVKRQRINGDAEDDSTVGPVEDNPRFREDDAAKGEDEEETNA